MDLRKTQEPVRMSHPGLTSTFDLTDQCLPGDHQKIHVTTWFVSLVATIPVRAATQVPTSHESSTRAISYGAALSSFQVAWEIKCQASAWKL